MTRSATLAAVIGALGYSLLLASLGANRAPEVPDGCDDREAHGACMACDADPDWCASLIVPAPFDPVTDDPCYSPEHGRVLPGLIGDDC